MAYPKVYGKNNKMLPRKQIVKNATASKRGQLFTKVKTAAKKQGKPYAK